MTSALTALLVIETLLLLGVKLKPFAISHPYTSHYHNFREKSISANTLHDLLMPRQKSLRKHRNKYHFKLIKNKKVKKIKKIK